MKKLDNDHFRARHQSLGGEDQVTQRKFDTEEEKFDGLGAGNLMSSKHTQSRTNALFLDTRVFNMSSAEYMPELSLPGALERLNSDDGTSPLNRMKQDKHTNFQTLRGNAKVSNDVSQMTQFKTADAQDLTQKISYNKLSKVCIPDYHIKAYYNHDMHPFFSPEKKEPADSKSRNLNRASATSLDASLSPDTKDKVNTQPVSILTSARNSKK